MTIVNRYFSRNFALSAAVAVFCLAGADLQAATTSTDTVTIVATAPTASELGESPGAFTISRSGSTGDLTVLLDSSTGSATAGVLADYDPIPGMVVLPAGQTSLVVPVIPNQDGVAEGGETIVVSIQQNAAYIVGNPFAAQIALADDDLRAEMQAPRIIAYERLSDDDASVSTADASACIFRVELKDENGNPFQLPNDSEGRITVDVGGSASSADYNMFWVLGTDTVIGDGYSTGRLLESGRRSLNSGIVGGAFPIVDGDGNVIGYEGNVFTVTAGRSRAGVGIFRDGDVISFEGMTTTYVIFDATDNLDGTYDIVLSASLPDGFSLPPGADVLTAIPIVPAGSGTRFTLTNFKAYDHIEFEFTPKADASVEGAESITMTLEGSNDFAIANPTAATGYIADTDAVVSITLLANTVEGGSAGRVRIDTSNPFPFSISIPFAVTGTASTSRFSIANTAYTTLTPAVGYGSVTLPAGSSSATVLITPIATAANEGVETVVITLSNSYDYVLAGSSNSGLNPSATVNIGDPGTVIVPPIDPPDTGGGTGGVRPVPTSSGSKGGGCGAGSSLALVLALALGLRFVGANRRD